MYSNTSMGRCTAAYRTLVHGIIAERRRRCKLCHSECQASKAYDLILNRLSCNLHMRFASQSATAIKALPQIGYAVQVAKLEAWHPSQHVLMESLSGALEPVTVLCDRGSNKANDSHPGNYIGTADVAFNSRSPLQSSSTRDLHFWHCQGKVYTVPRLIDGTKPAIQDVLSVL